MTTLRFHGHAAVHIEADDGTRLLLDPYRRGGFRGQMMYSPIHEKMDYVVCTHDHDDHAAVDTLVESPEIVVDGTVGAFDIVRVQFAHDEYDGRRRGGMVDVVTVTVDGFVVTHLSDVGQSPAGYRPPAPVDVLLVPVGGFFTIGPAQAREWVEVIAPRFAVPIHFRTAACSLPIADETAFVAHLPVIGPVDELELDRDGQNQSTRILQMRPLGLESRGESLDNNEWEQTH